MFAGQVTLIYHIFTVMTVSFRVWDDDLLKDATSLLLKEFILPSNVPGGMPEYRRSLVVSFFFKFYCTVKSQLPGKV